MYDIRRIVIPEFVIGSGSKLQAGGYLQNLGSRNVLLVTDHIVHEIGHTLEIEAILNELNIRYTIFKDITENPKDYESDNGKKVYKENRCDSIIAIGGGSVLDCAKAIAVLSTNDGLISEYEGVDMINNPIPPLVCIPTTAGTSADVSQFAIITNSKLKYKMALISKMLVPDVALIDPETLLTMPPELTSATGLDALTHAVESLVSSASSPFTDLHALDAASIIVNNLPKCLKDPDNMTYRSELMRASLQAGIAFSNASLGAVHAIAHSLGGLLNQPHGECNAVLLPHLIDSNFDYNEPKFMKLSQTLGFEGNINDTTEGKTFLLNTIKDLNSNVGMTKTLRDLGVTTELMPALASRALNDPCMITNPKEFNVYELQSILERAF